MYSKPEQFVGFGVFGKYRFRARLADDFVEIVWV